MKVSIAAGGALLAAVVLTSTAADARRGFLSGLVSRGAGAAVRHGGSGTSTATTTAIKSYGPDTLTQDQLESCVQTAKRLDDTSENLETEIGSVNRIMDEAKLLKARIENDQATLNRSSKSAVNAFNRRVDEYNGMLSRYRAAFAVYKPKEDDFNSSVNAYNAACAKKYYVDDMTAVKARLGLNVD